MGSGGRAPQVFISYRRADTEHVAGRIRDKLATVFGDEHVYFDISTIPPGVDFRDYIGKMVTECEFVLVLIGSTWSTITGKDGVRRLDKPDDWVRIEVATALARGIPVVPVLIDGAELPGADTLPDDLKDLTVRNAKPVRKDPDFHTDMERIIEGLLATLPAPDAEEVGVDAYDDGQLDNGQFAEVDGEPDPGALVEQGFARLQQGDDDGAIGDFHAAISMDPQAAYAVFGNGGAPDLGPGVAGPWVAYLQQRLMDGGAELVVDGEYGQETAEIVGAVQERLGMQPDGLVGPLTWLLLALKWPGIAPDLGVGATGPWVAHLQQLLVHGGLDLVVDGVYGPDTARAVAQAQKAVGVPANGIVGPDTWLELTVPT